MSLHAVAAQNFQFFGNDLIHRQRRVFIIGDHQADLDVPAPFAQTQNRVTTGDNTAQRIQRHVRAAAGQIVDGFDEVVFPIGVDDVSSPN